MAFLFQWIYLLSLSLWIGSIFFFSFITTPTLFSSLPRDMTSSVLELLFPRYYQVGYGAGSLLLLSTFLESFFVRQIPWIRLVFILVMLGCTCYAGLELRPKIHQLKVEMKSIDEETELGKTLKSRFGSLHGLSVILNLVVLTSGLFLLGIVALRLRT